MKVLLVSTYELGHQPLHLASPAAALRAAGHEVRTLDLSVDAWDDEPVAWTEAVALSVPMHTAMRLALEVAAEVRRTRPGLPVCLYGLYATVSQDLTLAGLADRVIAGEYEPELVAWVDGLAAAAGNAGTGGNAGAAESAGTAGSAGTGRDTDAGGDTRPGAVVDLTRGRFRTPERDGLPSLERYAHLAIGGDHRLAGYVEASHGCLHRCRHCPVPVIYDGRIRIVAEDVVLADVEALAAAGARHITFGDPDFLNGPQHSLRVVRAMHRRFPEMTFDCTVKVEHILRHAHLWPEFAASGCLFVVSAFETVDDEVLARLDKGHTAAEAAEAVELLRRYGIEIRPSFLPFTPWTTLPSILDLLDFVAVHDLVGNVDPVQYTIRLLVPEGSLLLDDPALADAGPYDPERLTYLWSSPDPAVDRLQARLAKLVERSQAAGEALETTYLRIRAAALEAATGRESLDLVEASAIPGGSTEGRPRLTEPWFC